MGNGLADERGGIRHRTLILGLMRHRVNKTKLIAHQHWSIMGNSAMRRAYGVVSVRHSRLPETYPLPTATRESARPVDVLNWNNAGRLCALRATTFAGRFRPGEAFE